MSMKNTQLWFDRPNLTYSPGQVVQGRLDLQQDKVKTFRGIYLKATGFCETHWTTSHTTTVNGKTRRYTKHHSGHETYFKQIVYLVGGEAGECTLSPGKYSFPFQILIPPECPSSFEESNGHIRYEFHFVVDRAFRIDQRTTERITVVSACDPNLISYCRLPMVIEMNKAYHTLFVSRGTVQALIKVPKAGFCPGEVVPIEVQCDNNSKFNLEKIKFQIRETITFRTTDDTRYKRHVIAKDKRGPLPKQSSHKWDVDLVVPYNLPLYNLGRCQLIDIDYDIVITLSSPTFHYDCQESRKIIIGHVPLIVPNGTGTNPMPEQSIPYQAIYPSAPNPPFYNVMPVEKMADGSSNYYENHTNASGSRDHASTDFGASSYMGDVARATSSQGQDDYVAPLPPPPYTQYGPDSEPSAPDLSSLDINK